MPLGRRQVIANERTDYDDFNAVGNLCMGNLALALAAFRDPRVPNPGVVRGLGLTANGTMSPVLGEGAAFVPGNAVVVPGLAIVEADQAVGTFDPNTDSNHYSRVDLVSIYYGWPDLAVGVEQDGTPEQKIIVDPNTGATAQQSVNTQKNGKGVVVITTGQAANNPVAPATPAGHLALYTVLVGYGVTEITQDNIFQAAPQSSGAQWIKGQGAGALTAAPWTSDGLLVEIPPARAALVLASVEIQPSPPDWSTLTPTQQAAAILPLAEGYLGIQGSAGNWLSVSHTPLWGVPIPDATTVWPPNVKLTTFGIATHRDTLTAYVHHWLGVTGIMWTSFLLYEWNLCAILL